MVAFSIVESWVVYDEGPAMFPGVARASDGDLVLTFCTVPDGLPGGQIKMMCSSDEGRTWSPPRIVAQALRPSAAALNAVGLTTLRDGTMLLPYNQVELHGSYDDRHVILFLLRSTDGGRTWDEPIQVTTDLVDPCMYGTILEVDGALLWPIWGRMGPAERLRSGLLKSHDGGTTWGDYRTIAYDPQAKMHGDYCFPRVSGFDADGNFDPGATVHPEFRPHVRVDGFNETYLTLLSEGTVLALLRQQGVGSNNRLDLYQARSTDEGDTWSEPRLVGMCGMSPCLHWSPGGRLMLAYRRCSPEGEASAQPGVALSWSEDGGQTWQGEVVLVDPSKYRYTAEYQAGYPAMVTLEEGNILVVFYSYNPNLPHGRYLAANLVREAD